MTDAPHPPYARHLHAIRNHLTTLMGNAQLLRRRITRTTDVTPPERDPLLGRVMAIERATRELQNELAPPESPPSAT